MHCSESESSAVVGDRFGRILQTIPPDLQGTDLRDASKTLRAAGLTIPVRKDKKPVPEMPAADGLPVNTPASIVDAPSSNTAIDLTLPADYARHRAAVLSERLINSKTSSHDDALREEIADIAATMVALTAAKEGPASPIPALLKPAGAPTEGNEKSLAGRVRDMLPPEQP